MVDELPAEDNRVELIASRSIGLIREGDDLASIIAGSFASTGVALSDGDVIVIAQKFVSKAEGRYAYLADVAPSPRARELAGICEKDPHLVELILRESREVLRCVRNVIVVENHHGIVLANAGIDRSNVGQTDRGERVLLLPTDPDASAKVMRDELLRLTGAHVGVIINDSIGRAWRMGTVGAAIGVSGLAAVQDKRGEADLFGFRLRTTEVANADEIAAAASLLMGQSDEGTPVVLVRGLKQSPGSGRAADLIRPRAQDLFR
jgi:coenzyme F420-0:L-glutamate ligase/coenzyme F420-1:gamma-L-glutamate ligase